MFENEGGFHAMRAGFSLLCLCLYLCLFFFFLTKWPFSHVCCSDFFSMAAKDSSIK